MSQSWTWRHAILKADLAPTTRHVLLTISCHMNDVGEGCYPTVATLAEETGLSDRAVFKHIKIATDEGWLEVTKHGFAGQKWANNEYAARFPDPEKGHAPRSGVAKEVLNLTTEGPEPNDKKVLNEVQTNISLNIPSSSNSKKSAKPIDFLAPVVGQELGQDVIAHRKLIKKPMTARAAKMLASQFAKCPDPILAAETMIARGWIGFEPQWMENQKSRSNNYGRNQINGQEITERVLGVISDIGDPWADGGNDGSNGQAETGHLRISDQVASR